MIINVTLWDILQKSNPTLKVEDLNKILWFNIADDKYKLGTIFGITEEQFKELGISLYF
jgi:ABC-type enterochelin transport system substrate-binding protein